MGEVVTVRLEDVLVDPRLSPRRVCVEEGYLERLGLAWSEGAEWPALEVARIADRTAGWCGAAAPHNRRQRVERAAEARGVAWSNLPPLPEYVLVDGVSRYWALRQAGVSQAECEVAAEAVGSGREVTVAAYRANATHGRLIDDWDQRRAFVRLWLGREVNEREQWRPGPEGMGASEAAALLGHGVGWASKMQAWLRVEYATKLELSMSCAYALSSAPEGAWWEFCWIGEGSERVERQHPVLDETLSPVVWEAPRPVREMSRQQLERHVKVLLAAPVEREAREERPEPAADPPGATVAGGEQLTLEFGSDWSPEVTGEPHREGFEVARATAKRLMELAPKMARETLAGAVLEVTMVEVDAREARAYLGRVAKAHGWAL